MTKVEKHEFHVRIISALIYDAPEREHIIFKQPGNLWFDDVIPCSSDDRETFLATRNGSPVPVDFKTSYPNADEELFQRIKMSFEMLHMRNRPRNQILVGRNAFVTLSKHHSRLTLHRITIYLDDIRHACTI